MNKRDVLSLALKISSPHGVKKSLSCILDGKKVVETVFNITSEYIEYVLIDEKRFSSTEKETMKDIYGEKLVLTDELFLKKIKQTKTSQGILAIAKKPPIKGMDGLYSNFGRCVYFDNVQNPENAGAIIRTGLSMGWNNFIFSEGSVSTSNVKFIRSSSGYAYKASIFEQDADTLSQKFFDKTSAIVADIDGEPIEDIKVSGDENILLIVGNEGQGVSGKIHKLMGDRRLKFKKCSIPMKNEIDSLSVSQAAAILLYIFKPE